MSTQFLLKPVPHDEASQWIASKPVLARTAFDKLLPDLKARAFTITGIESANVMQNVRNRIADLPQGADWDKVKADIAAQISPWLDDGAEDRKSESGQPSTLSPSERRAELLLRTHGYQAYTVASEDVAARQQAAFPFAQYFSAHDDHVRDSHEALDGLIVPVDSPFWDNHTPPWEWGCRCFKVFLTAPDVADMQAADEKKKPEARRVIAGDRLRALENSNQLVVAGPGGMPRFVNVEPSRSFTFDRSTIRMNAADLKPRYDAETWAVFEAWARKQALDTGGTVWGWLTRAGSTPAARPRPVAPPVVVPPPAPPTTQITPAAPAAPAGPENTARPAPPSVPPPVAAPVIPPVSQPVPPVRQAPVSRALDVRTTGPQKPQIETALRAIDQVHDDGDLPQIAIIGRSGNSLGIYQFTHSGSAVQIGIGNYAEKWPGLTTAHEVGHFLDHQVLGIRGKFASVESPDLAPFRQAVTASKSYQELTNIGVGLRGEFLKPYELWARAYAQYIATKSGDPLLVAQLQKIRSGPQPWRQWSDEDFKPISSAIDDLFKKKGWIA